MSYFEENGEVVLRMRIVDYNLLTVYLRLALDEVRKYPDEKRALLEFVNRLNEGNPGFVPHQV
jgi:hypothetical protein